jgi:hypothetical protein
VQLASWIPSMPLTLSPKRNNHSSIEKHQWILDALSPHVPVVAFPDFSNKMDLATIDDDSPLPLSVMETMKNLFEQGSNYLYGLLLDKSVILQHASPSPYGNASLAPVDYELSVSIAMDGSFLTDPQFDFENDVSQRLGGCLEQIRQTALAAIDSSPHCYIYAAYPNPVTSPSSIHKLQEWLSFRNCTLVTTNDYLTDLVSASKHAHSAFLGHQKNSSSSDLLLSIVEYHRRQEIWKLGRDPPLVNPIPQCNISMVAGV